jgi:UDP-sulfoquinovose synthase
MGEYGTPNIDIEEGWLEVSHNGRKDTVLYPKKPHSYYHLSKVHDSHNIEFTCRVWGLRATDLNQGCVYGINTDETEIDPMLRTSFHYDDIFGTVVNRFLVQASIESPLTIYGEGGQTRGFLNIKDTLNCVEIAVDNPADKGEFRVFNQFTEQFSIIELAEQIQRVGKSIGKDVKISHLENPRIEEESHYYNAKHTKLVDLGLNPFLMTDDVVKDMLMSIINNPNKVDKSYFNPRVKWKQ